MKAIVDAQSLAAAMKYSVAQRRGTLPALRMARITAIKTGLKIETTDMQAWVSVEIDADVSQDTTICLDADSLARVLQSLTGDVTLHDKGIDGPGGQHWRLPSVQADEWPDLYHLHVVDDLGDLDIAGIIKRVAYASAKGDIRYYLNGMSLINDPEFDDAGAAVATDGHLLAWDKIKYTGRDMVIPVQQLRPLQAVAASSETIAIHTLCRVEGDAPIALRVCAGRISYVTLLIDIAKLPDFKSMLVTNNPLFQAQVAVSAIKPVLARAVALGSAWEIKTTIVRLKTNGAGIVIDAKNFDETIEVDNLNGSGSINVQAPLLLSCLASLDEEVFSLVVQKNRLIIETGDTRHLLMECKF